MKNCPMKELCYERFSNETCDNCIIDKTLNKKDKEIAHLTAEVAELSHENDELELRAENLEEQLTRAKDEVDEMRARLEKAVELPCELGSPLYVIDETRDADSWELKPCIINKYSAAEVTVCENGDFLFQVETSTLHKRLRFGEDIFVTREEAEARLKELQGGEEQG